MNFRSFAPIALAVATALLGASCGSSVSTLSAPASANLQRSIFPDGLLPNASLRSLLNTHAASAHRGAHIAVAEFGASEVFWFKLNDKNNHPPVTCEPASSTNGIAIDRHRNLWVPNGKANTITEYAPNCGAAKLTISDTTGEPADISFDGKYHVYVLNLSDISGPPTIEIYDSRSGTHVGTLTDPSFHDLFGIGTDGHGNVFVSNLTTANVGTVVEFPKGKMPGTGLSDISLGLPGAPAFDKANDLIITDWEHYTINVFTPPYTSAPTTATLEGASIWCKLDAPQTDLYCGDADNGTIDVYAYPGVKYGYSYTAGLSPSALVTGVAPDPPAAL